MKRIFAIIFLLVLSALPAELAIAAPNPSLTTKSNFHATLTGTTRYFNPAGMLPNFDLVNRVIIALHVHAGHDLHFRLYLYALLDSFQTDTQPRLPDLIHPKVTLHRRLGGYFSGLGIVVNHADKVLFEGPMRAEALIKPSCMHVTSKTAPPVSRREVQHMLVRLRGQGPATGSRMKLLSVFVGNQKLRITSGSLYGRVHLTAQARRQLRLGSGVLTSRRIVNTFTLRCTSPLYTNHPCPRHQNPP